MRNEEEKFSATDAGKSAFDIAKERLQNKNTKIAIGILLAIIALSVIIHFVA